VRAWVSGLLVLGAVVQVACMLPYRLPLMLLGALLLGFVAQGVKISVDTLVQQQVADEFRGRVFSLYDTLFNVTLVVAAVLTATVLPENGYSPTSVVLITLGYAVTAIGYLRLTSRVQPTEPAVVNS
jgi:MFS family permease